jgi:hypothetical protein
MPGDTARDQHGECDSSRDVDRSSITMSGARQVRETLEQRPSGGKLEWSMPCLPGGTSAASLAAIGMRRAMEVLHVTANPEDTG